MSTSAATPPKTIRTGRRAKGTRAAVIAFWIMAAIAIPIWTHFDKPAWDYKIYLCAVESLKAGHDPYADAIAVQKQFHATLAQHPNEQVPYSYVYSPLTLPLVRLFGAFPLWLAGTAYWLLYLFGALAQVWVALWAREGSERRSFLLVAPAAVFFPAMLSSDTILSGNVAMILYGLALLAALRGWRHGKWLWFYTAVVAASCFKAPLLSLLAIPLLSARAKWLGAGLAAVVGAALFAVQPMLYPSLFRHFIEAVELQFSFNQDFGVSPAGLFSGWLMQHGHPYAPGSYLFYLAYALPLFATLLYLSRQYLAGRFDLKQWVPVMLVGVILLNPRLIEYDLLPMAIPVALVFWRFFALFSTRFRFPAFLVFFAVVNAIALQSWPVWKLTAGPLLVVCFLAGAYTLLRHKVAEPGSPA